MMSVSVTFVILFQQYLVFSHTLTPRLISISRKLFHVMICCVYIPGLLYDIEFLSLCSYGMLILFLLIELIRYYKIGGLSNIIDETMALFADRKDQDGQLILSHIYLLIGLSLPIWLSNHLGI
jgi:dolichol kinase